MKNLEIVKTEYGFFDIIVDGQVVGAGEMNEAGDDGDFNYLERIDIDEQYRGKGYGTKALYQLSDIYGTYYLAADNENAKRLYDRIAYEMDQATYDAWGFAIDQGFGVHVID